MYEKYGKVIALKGVNCEVKDGELLTILGPSGAGKLHSFKRLQELKKSLLVKYIENKELINFSTRTRCSYGIRDLCSLSE